MGALTRRGAALAAAVLLAGSALASGALPAAAIPSDTEIATEDFESGLDGWDIVTGGNGSVGTVAGNGGQVVRIDVPQYDTGSIAYIKKTLSESVYAISVSGSFNVPMAGCDADAGYSAGSVPMIRFFDSDNRRVAGLYRINGNCAGNTKVYVQHSGGFHRVGSNMRLNTWVPWELRITVNGNQSLVEVYQAGGLAYRTTVANNGIVPIRSVNLHNEHVNQVGTLLADNLRIATFGTAPPTNPCTPSTPLPTNAAPGTVVLADAFESYDFAKWSSTGLGGDGSATFVTSPVVSGTCAAKLHSSSASGSRAFLRKDLPAGATRVDADASFNVVADGLSGSNVAYWRLFNGSARLVDVYRLNGSGQVYARTPNGSGGFVYTSLGRTWTLGSWHKVRVSASIPDQTLAIYLDGTLAKTFTGVPYGATSFSSAMIASEHFSQKGDLVTDDAIIKIN